MPSSIQRRSGAPLTKQVNLTRCAARIIAMSRVCIQSGDFDLGAETEALRLEDGGVGAVVAFVGTVREHSAGQAVSQMELEHYPGMTEAAIEAMVDEALARFDIRAARVIHRVGTLQARDQIVLVLVTSAHRGQAFQACEFLMDYLKTQAPFWKKEYTPEGAHWVDARVADDEALARWGIAAGNAS
ncbi:MAG: molybdenum cofactor biosynthesis protein MoaE [Rubrivivax sp.]|nr:MAG: molybdenum cofactor biosynthesis protein MoaE [Rubrivivax sp.]